MYNRYIPQSDGTYRKNIVRDALQEEKPRHEPPPCPEPEQTHPHEQQPQPSPCAPSKPQERSDAMGFLRRLLPKDFDTGDLLIIVLLLLMAGDCKEDNNTALLTLALYLFM